MLDAIEERQKKQLKKLVDNKKQLIINLMK